MGESMRKTDGEARQILLTMEEYNLSSYYFLGIGGLLISQQMASQ